MADAEAEYVVLDRQPGGTADSGRELVWVCTDGPGQVGYPEVRVQIGLLFLKIGFYVLEETVVVVIRLEVADQFFHVRSGGRRKG